MRINEKRLRRIIRNIIIESENDSGDDWVKIWNNLSPEKKKKIKLGDEDGSDNHKDIGLHEYCLKVFFKLKNIDFTVVSTNASSVFNEPIKIGKKNNDQVDVRKIISDCHKNKKTFEECAEECAKFWKKENKLT